MKSTINTEEIKNIVEKTNLKHIAIIMDGNRRWAKEKNLPSAMGHQKGVSALKTTLKACAEFGINYLTVYAFSTENWNRKQEEVDFLMKLLAKTLGNELQELHRENVKIIFVGNIDMLSADLKSILRNAEDVTKNNSGVTLQIAFNYGSRMELTQAVRAISKKVHLGELDIDDITEDTISAHLYTSNAPDPDLLIRTGGELRVSNYLLWQIAYSEIYVIPEFWPEFNKELLAHAVMEFENRNRRYGK